MALVKCGECGQEVSDKALSCPHCGNPIRTSLFLEDSVLADGNSEQDLNAIIRKKGPVLALIGIAILIGSGVWFGRGWWINKVYPGNPINEAEIKSKSSGVSANTGDNNYVRKDDNVSVDNKFNQSPLNITLELSPGQTAKRSIFVQNRFGSEKKFSVEKKDVKIEETSKGRQPELLDERADKFSARDWFKMGLNEFTLKHGETQYFEVTITVPENAEPGEYNTAVLTGTEANYIAINSVRTTSRIATLFLIKILNE